MDESKIQLSAEEWQLLQNSGWILTKHAVIDKVYQLFGQVAHGMQQQLQAPHRLPEAVLHQSPKIAKGEQYQRLPWVVLDYPRYFSKEHVFAIRHFFWWGHYFSSTLQLKGRFQQQLAPVIEQEAAAGRLAGYYWCAGGDEFNFDIKAEGYWPMAERPPVPGELQNAPFVKLTATYALEHWDTMPEKLLAAFERFIAVADR